MAHGIRFNLNTSLYVRDPQDTEYGRKLLENSILLMHEIGFEAFTFRKLAKVISSTEASIYRYFENKHLLLLYLTSWYWEWVHYLVEINSKNISDAKERLRITIHNIVSASSESPLTPYVNEELLHQIIINEGAKAYHTHKVDDENEVGLFQSYKQLVDQISDVILEVNPTFPYSHSMASNLFEMSNNQIFFAKHLPRLTDIEDQESTEEDLETMLNYIMDKVLVKDAGN